MKLASCFYNNRVTCGIVTPEGFIDIPTATQDNPKNRLHSVKEILIKGASALETLQKILERPTEKVPYDNLMWLAPIPKPNKILALAGNYPQHIQETGRYKDLPNLTGKKSPIRPFMMPPTAACGHQKTILWPLYSEEVDYEIELAVIIGKTARALSPERAKNVIAGYTIANDISARSVTFGRKKEAGGEKDFYEWLMGKWSDDFLPLGPWMVTADEIADPQNLQMTLKVNGEVRQNASTAEMIYTVYEIVSFLSYLMTLEPGDVIATGTPHGVGAATGRYLQPGDVMECTIEGIGTLTNRMGEKPPAFYTGVR
ncbi:MAG TPA: fumarylacetoacetate hydrolase family protein [Anaerohalosphaeraceae bacterium]|nr:fumarylacetoacetate hydrolase family protein [Anaerohalosphaeraceae bacterium]HOL89050.1 fumarylacetoacetate hydrolase family protein [Anaerohalosphaeraceae bacterium]HPP56916.1 fumarylacetoacetate hydrolase family protein [Anaerohalosphaeraceae bacterium]